MLAGVALSVIPYWFIYQIIAPLLTRQELLISDVIWRIIGIAVCLILHAFLYVKGLSLSYEAAYHTLKNLRIYLQQKLEQQPLGTIQAKGVGTIKKMFIDDIESIELLLAHALPEGIANIAVPVFVFLAMFFTD